MYKIIIISFTLFTVANLSDVSFYETLGVKKQASSQEIRQAYKKLAIKLHPDKNPDEKNQEKFLKVTEAYETLKDPDKRRKYDLYGSYQTYSRKYDYKSQTEYDNLFYNGLYHNDPYVDTLSGKDFYSYLKEGFYFINFYSPFCPPCQNVAAHWKKIAEMYKGIVKVGAVNCKYHNNFCYNSMRIGSYPTLLFYPNGKNGNYYYYQGDRTLDALDNFVMKFLRNKVNVPTVVQIRPADRPFAYVLGNNRIDRNALTRIAYQLNGLVTVAIVEDEDLRQKLTNNGYATVVFRYKDITKEFETTDEKELLKDIANQLPYVELIDPAKLKTIRNDLRSGSSKPWVLYFSSKDHDKLELHQMSISSIPNIQFGEIDCAAWSELCASLQVKLTPAWAVLKQGGAYQLVDKNNIQIAIKAINVHSLSNSEVLRIFEAATGTCVLLLIPERMTWEHLNIADPFTRASLQFIENPGVHFGIALCSSITEKYCQRVAPNEPAVILFNNTREFIYSDPISENDVVDFLRLLMETDDVELNEQQLLDIMSGENRSYNWLVAHLPARCDSSCSRLAMQWRIVARKLRPLKSVRVGLLDCAHIEIGFCANIRSPTARFYPIGSEHHHSVSLQQVTDAPYMLEWALERIDDSVQKLNWHTFTKTVIAEELNPSSNTKPWLVYFHSPRCYRCYEMYPNFALAGIFLNNAVHLGKVNCLNERGLCQHEQITSYPSLKLYLNRNQNQRFSSVINVQIRDHKHILEEINPHLTRYNRGLGVTAKHDEF